ncbi:MAG: bifunctional UDP-N-acetylmuramoyl-tripeptide:D-alanyl-D-alanine ligase/alanine racemase [Prevotellaceae bacterium]|jgi:alanine racemase|nr:bifunctional UDP-N-acetylmuramoyl-tripeptide:D-alanyl-D-alanine ligase/alanine racemase [Prevotellaceae bacterium]
MEYTVEKIAKTVNGKFRGNGNALITRIFTDSRNQTGEELQLMFVAINGKRHDGHKYIDELFRKGVRNFLVINGFDCQRFAGANFVFAENTVDAIQKIAADYRSLFSFPVLGITGSNGKTCVKEWIYRILKDTKKISRSPKSYNSQIGAPLSVLMADDDSDLGIFEAGISMPEEMSRLEKIIRPEIGIFTNAGDAHQENFTSIEHKIREKLNLFENSKTLIYCSDNVLVDKTVSELKPKFRTFVWGHNENCNIELKEKICGEKTVLYLKINDKNLNYETCQQLEIPFSDSASIENIMHCIAFAMLENVDINVIKANLSDISPVAMRLEVKEGVNRCTVINDSYNSDINSLTIALDFLDGMSRYRKKTVILSDILQSEPDEKKLYRQVSELLKNRGINKLTGIGRATGRNSDLLIKNSGIENCAFYDSVDEFLANCNKADFNNEAILLKGSRSFRFEKISRLLEFKIHQTILDVNMDAIVHNLNFFRAKLKKNVKLTAMVKAFSYGHGSVEIASLLQYHRVDYLAVAYADEGISLREAGISMPIVVLNTDPDNFDIMMEYRLEPEIYSINSLETFIKIAAKTGICNYPVHIKFDTGMHRLGMTENDLPKLCEIIVNSKEIKPASLFSHLAASDDCRHDDFTKMQISRFSENCRYIEENTGCTPLKHILNSSGIERFPEAQFDMVRLGIGLYGIGTEYNRTNLLPAETLSSAIVQIKNVEQGETIGYGRHNRIDAPKKIATVPIGYADGLDRKLGNGAGYFTINGQSAPIIGNICMDACMIDITGIDAAEGDRVTVIGDKPSVYEIADILQTIPYEIMTSISERVKRVYSKIDN